MHNSDDPAVTCPIPDEELQFRPEEITQILEARQQIADGEFFSMAETKALVKERTKAWGRNKGSRSA